jgi:hypothetical protein
VNAPLIHLLKEFVIVAIVDVNSNDYRAWRVEGLFEHSSDLVRRLDHEASCSERFRVLHRIDRAKLCAGRPAILLLFLNGHHVIRPVDPYHVYEMRLEPDRRLKFHRREQKSAVAGDGQDLLRWAHECRCNGPGKRNPKRLLSVAHQQLARPEAVQVARQPYMK